MIFAVFDVLVIAFSR